MQRKPLRKLIPKPSNQPSRVTPCCMIQATSKTIKKSNKQNTQKAFFMQNQCEILKLKGRDIEVSVKGLKQQLLELEDNKKTMQKQCLQIQKQIQQIQDGNIPDLKTNILKLQLTQKNKIVQIKQWDSKIMNVKKSIQQKHFNYQQQSSKYNNLQVQKWRLRSQNQGMKKVKTSLELEIDQLNQQKISLKQQNIEYEPEQQKMNENIQNTIKQVNRWKQDLKQKLSVLSGKSLIAILSRLYKKVMTGAFQSFIVGITQNRLKKKTFYNIMNIHQKFIDRIKAKYLQRFKRIINHKQQEKILIQSIKLLKNNKKKFRVLAIWKKQFMKVQYSLLRKQQVFSSLVQILKGVQGSLVYGGFNVWKNWTKRMRSGGDKIKGIVNLFNKKKLRKGFSSIFMISKNILFGEIQEDNYYSKSSLTILQKYFKAWSHHMQSIKINSLALKYKVFNIFKQNQKQSRRLKYLEMIHLIIKKNNMTKLLMKSFYGLQISTKLQTIKNQNIKGQEIESIIQKQSVCNIKQINKKKIKCRQIGITRLQNYMKDIMKQSFDRLRQLFSYSLKLSSFQLSLKRMFTVQDLSKSFRNILTTSTLANHLNIKSEIDNHTLSIKNRVQELATIKDEQNRIKELSNKSGNEYLIRFIDGVYTRILTNTLIRIKDYGINRAKLLSITRRVGAIINKFLSKRSFLTIKQLSQNQAMSQCYRLRINNFKKKKNQIIQKGFFNQLSKGLSNNKNLAKIIKHVTKIMKHYLIQSSFDEIRIRSIYQKNVQLFQKQRILCSQLLKLQCQSKTNKQNSITKISEYRSKIKGSLFYTQRHHINQLNKIIRNPASSALQIWHSISIKQNKTKQLVDRLDYVLNKILIKRGFELLIINCNKILSNQQILKYNQTVLQYENNSKKAQSYSQQLQKQINALKHQSSIKQQQLQYYSKILNNFQCIKLNQFNKSQNIRVIKSAMESWRQESIRTKTRINNLVNILLLNTIRDPFDNLCQLVKQHKKDILFKSTITNCCLKVQRCCLKNTLIHWYKWKNQSIKSYLHNQIQSKIKCHDVLEKKTETVQQSLENQVIHYFNNTFKSRLFNRMKGIINKKQIQKLLLNNTKQRYKVIVCRQAIYNLWTSSRQSKYTTKCYESIESNNIKSILKQSFNGWKSHHTKLQKFNKVFLNDYISYNIKSYQFDFFRNIKLYSQQNKIKRMQRSNNIINKLVTFYQNSFMLSLQKGFLKWRSNMKTIQNRRQFLKRLFNKANNNKLFHAWNVWKLESTARYVQYYHQTQGEIKVKQNQFNRIRKYINDFKEIKGLVVIKGDQLISSPRYQQKQETDIMSHNNKKYQLLSRLILLQNQQSDKIHLWNSLKYHLKLSEEMRNKSLFVHNMMKNHQKYWGFRKWRKQIVDEKQRLDTIDKNQLINQIKCVQEKIQILHSSKNQLKQDMGVEIKRTQNIHKVLATKQVLSKILVFRAGKILQKQAISEWHLVYKQIQAKQAQTIELMAIRRIQQLTEELESLEYSLSLSLNLNEQLKTTAMEGVQIAETLKYLTSQRDQLNDQIKQQSLTCEALSQQNLVLQQRFNLAQKQAYQLLSLARN